MKNIILAICLSSIMQVFSQSTHTYTYDASGNLLNKQVAGNTPVVNVAGDSLVCASATATFTASAPNAVSYSWHHGGNSATATVQPQQTTVYKVTVTGSNGCQTIQKWKVKADALPSPGVVVGDTLPFNGSNYTYTLPPHPNSFYQWFVVGGNLVSGYGLPQSTIEWTGDFTGMIKIVETNNQGCKSDTLFRPVVFQKTQQKVFVQGWNLFSTYIDVTNPAIANVFQPVNTPLLEVKEEQNTYINDPQYISFNSLQTIADGQGYWVKMATPCTLTISGVPLRPTQVAIPLQTGWNLIGYSGQYSKLVASAFSSVLPNIAMVKNAAQSYNPSYPMAFNTLDHVYPGDAYWVEVTAPCTLYFPTPDISGNRLTEIDSLGLVGWQPVYYTTSEVAYGNVTLDEKPILSEGWIGAFVGDECRAIAKVNNEMGYGLASMVLNGVHTDTVCFRLFHEGEIFYSDYQKTIQENYNGNPADLLPLAFKRPVSPLEDMFLYPNPFSGTLNVELKNLPNGTLNIYNALGEQIANYQLIENSVFEWIPDSNLADGVYYFQFQTGDRVISKKVVLQQ